MHWKNSYIPVLRSGKCRSTPQNFANSPDWIYGGAVFIRGYFAFATSLILSTPRLGLIDASMHLRSQSCSPGSAAWIHFISSNATRALLS